MQPLAQCVANMATLLTTKAQVDGVGWALATARNGLWLMVGIGTAWYGVQFDLGWAGLEWPSVDRHPTGRAIMPMIQVLGEFEFHTTSAAPSKGVVWKTDRRAYWRGFSVGMGFAPGGGGVERNPQEPSSRGICCGATIVDPCKLGPLPAQHKLPLPSPLPALTTLHSHSSPLWPQLILFR